MTEPLSEPVYEEEMGLEEHKAFRNQTSEVYSTVLGRTGASDSPERCLTFGVLCSLEKPGRECEKQDRKL